MSWSGQWHLPFLLQWSRMLVRLLTTGINGPKLSPSTSTLVITSHLTSATQTERKLLGVVHLHDLPSTLQWNNQSSKVRNHSVSRPGQNTAEDREGRQFAKLMRQPLVSRFSHYFNLFILSQEDEYMPLHKKNNDFIKYKLKYSNILQKCKDERKPTLPLRQFSYIIQSHNESWNLKLII